MRDLTGRIALVTGASRGIGAHIARALSKAGVSVGLVARDRTALERLAEELALHGPRAVAIGADLTQPNALDNLLERAHVALGGLDILINNAGIDAVRFYTDETDAETEQMLKLDLLAPMLLARRALPQFLAQKRGHIINVASLAGKTAMPYSVSYSAAKAGLIAFTHSLRAELSGTGVSASVICPGFVTGEGMFADRQREHGVRVSRIVGSSKPEQVASAVLAALREDHAEIAVNPGPVRLMHAVQQLAPSAIVWLQDRLGVNGMLRSVASSGNGRRDS